MQGEIQQRIIAYIDSSSYMCPWPKLPPQSWTAMLADSEYMQKLAFLGDSRLGFFVTERLSNGTKDGSACFMSMGRSVLCSNATFEHIRLKANGGPLTVTSTRASGTVFEAVAESIFVDMGASEFKTWGLKTFLPLVHEFRKELNTLLSLQPTIPPSLRPLGKGNQRPLEPTINTGIRLSEREFIELSQLSIEEQEVRARRCADEVLQHMIDEAEDQCLPSPSLSLSKDIWDQAHSDFGLALQEYTRRTRESPLVGQAGFIARERRVKGPKPKRLAAKQEKKKEPKAMSKCPADTESQKKLTKSQKKKRERARRLKMEKKKEAKRDRKASKARKAKI